MNKPKAKKPKKTAQEKALEKRQIIQLDDEIEESERKFKALARGKLGAQSLLSGVPMRRKGFKSVAPKSKYGRSKIYSPAPIIEDPGD